MPYARTSLTVFSLANPIYAAAEVSFYTVDESGEKTDTLASLYQDTVGATLLPNPQTLDADGKFLVPVYIEDPVVGVVAANANFESEHETGVISNYGRWRGAHQTGILYYPNDLIQDSVTKIIYAALQVFSGGVSVAQDITDGNLEQVLEPEDLTGVYLPLQRTVSAKTGDYDLLAEDSGKMFTNEAAVAAVTFFLPTAAAGIQYTIYVQAAQQVVLDANTGDTIRNGVDVTSSGGTLYSSAAGSMLSVVAINATEWIVETISGTWEIT